MVTFAKIIFMHFEKPVPISWIAEFIEAKILGNKDGKATGINEIHKVEKGDIVFVDHPKYYNTCIHSAATFILINKETAFPEGKTLLVVNDPFESYLKLVNHFRPFAPSMKMISATSKIGEGTVIMPNTYVGNYVNIGNNCIIYPNVTILDHCIIGDNVIIQPGSVIGSDAFYYNKKTNRNIHYKKMNSCGRVIIEDDVEIGAGCTLDRGVSGDTIIGAGTKMDNLIHIGHDTVIGKNCLFAAQVGIAGATTIEDEVTIWGQAGINKTLTIGKGAVINAQSGIAASLEGGKTYFGSPAIDAKEKLRELVWVKRIPELWEKVVGNKKTD
jgi:UDP-3-O-[3-hydroxymyristoyl] glucosamine N-acyltransferase